MIETIVEMLSYPFMVRAFVVGILVALCSALLGVSLVLKRYSMIGDGLSHVGFGALAVAAACNVAPLTVAIPVVVVAAVLLLRLNGNSKMNGDAAIALISTSALAIGVMVSMFTAITVTKNFMHLIFGTGELKHPGLFGLKKDEIGKSYEATETKREKARFGILD